MMNIAPTRLQAARPRFGNSDGNGEVKQPQAQTANGAGNAAAANQASQAGQKPGSTNAEQLGRQSGSAVKGFFSGLAHRLQRFFKDIAKAFSKLLGREKPKSPLKSEVKRFEANVERLAQLPEIQKASKELGSNLEKFLQLPNLPVTEDQKQQVAEQVKLLQTKDGPEQFLKRDLSFSSADGLATINDILESEEGSEEVSTRLAFLNRLTSFNKGPQSAMPAAAETVDSNPVPAEEPLRTNASAATGKSAKEDALDRMVDELFEGRVPVTQPDPLPTAVETASQTDG